MGSLLPKSDLIEGNLIEGMGIRTDLSREEERGFHESNLYFQLGMSAGGEPEIAMFAFALMYPGCRYVR